MGTRKAWCAIEILDTQTGETAAFEDYGSIWMDDEDESYLNDFQWAEGNYACDCNRAIFWHRALGHPENLDRPCGDGRYLVRAVRLDLGTVVFDEIRPQAEF